MRSSQYTRFKRVACAHSPRLHMTSGLIVAHFPAVNTLVARVEASEASSTIFRALHYSSGGLKHNLRTGAQRETIEYINALSREAHVNRPAGDGTLWTSPNTIALLTFTSKYQHQCLFEMLHWAAFQLASLLLIGTRSNLAKSARCYASLLGAQMGLHCLSPQVVAWLPKPANETTTMCNNLITSLLTWGEYNGIYPLLQALAANS